MNQGLPIRFIHCYARAEENSLGNLLTHMKDKVAIVTGASSGIGRATALLFASNGAEVVAVGRNESGLNSLLDETRGSEHSLKIQLRPYRRACERRGHSQERNDREHIA